MGKPIINVGDQVRFPRDDVVGTVQDLFMERTETWPFSLKTALVNWPDGSTMWIPCKNLEVVQDEV
jgi:hypothetical protein